MEALARPRPATSVLYGVASALAATAQALSALAQRLDAWLAHRQRAARDAADLAQMSDRELRDIGLARGFLDAVADERWTREPVR
jgi:uncharacterized protein YjiS (DUF1127 family)